MLPDAAPQKAPLARLPAHLVAAVALYSEDALRMAAACRGLRRATDDGVWRRAVERDHGGPEAARALATLLSLPAPKDAVARDLVTYWPLVEEPARPSRGTWNPNLASTTSWAMPGGILFEGAVGPEETPPPLRVVATEDGLACIAGTSVPKGGFLGDLAGETAERPPHVWNAGPNAAADARDARGGVLGEGLAAVMRDPTLRRFFGDKGEVYIDTFDRRNPGGGKKHWVVSGARRGNVLLRNCRHVGDAGAPEAPTATPEIRIDDEGRPSVRLRAARDLDALEEICWMSLHVMSGPVVREAARNEPEVIRETKTKPQTNELGKLLGIITSINAKHVKRQGTHILYAY